MRASTGHRCFEALAPHFQILAPDLPGFGVSAPLPMPSYQNYLNWLQLLFDMLNIGGPLLLMGNSFGAVLSRFFAAENTGYVSRLVLIDGGAIVDAPGCLRPLYRLPILSNLIFECHAPADLFRRWPETRDRRREACSRRSLSANAQAASTGFRGGPAADRADVQPPVTAHAHLPHPGDLGRAGSADLSRQTAAESPPKSTAQNSPSFLAPRICPRSNSRRVSFK